MRYRNSKASALYALLLAPRLISAYFEREAGAQRKGQLCGAFSCAYSESEWPELPGCQK